MILYLTRPDAELIRIWLNHESLIAWILKESQVGHAYTWRASDTLDAIEPGSYCLWHKTSCRLNVPSGRVDVADAIVADPYRGWTQRLDHLEATEPWFGGN